MIWIKSPTAAGSIIIADMKNSALELTVLVCILSKQNTVYGDLCIRKIGG